MREIKFRSFQNNKILLSPISSNYGLQRFFGLLYEDAPIMQYTGFKDKNGLDIFEGDILSDWNDFDGEQVQSFVQVFWCEKDGAWKLDNSFDNDKSSGDLLSEELSSFVYEVTGNIYENPELLKN